ncbi:MULTISPECIES: hypothetical protein [unclassified Streptomyces]|uniref:hypothetical protein n=1 Tax=unclassified Streptomyces TaxID=2593676 RepID=UPI0022B6EB8B|nr:MULTISPECIES: hypothetical protein [unclassified Streptomyces]MCZ7416353.1 hypothetical protein [Streptomyces sp. WMMC897]MCZ7433837.1 hypothetical protein [Streptomyces sp. WMMC1477]
MSTYAIRYAERAARRKAALPAPQRSALERLEKQLSANPFGNGARSNQDNSWTAFFTGGMTVYVVSNRHVVINVIDLVAV